MNYNELLEKIALMRDISQEEVHKEMEIAIITAYESGNRDIRLIKKDGSMPTVEEYLAYIVEQVRNNP